MNRVRFDKNFQNPILRLGRTGSTYSEILSTSSIDNIKTHYRAVKKEYEKIESDIAKTANTLKEDIEAEIVSYGDVDLVEIRELIELEQAFAQTNLPVDLAEFLIQNDGAMHLEEIRNVCTRLIETFRPSKGWKLEARITDKPRQIVLLHQWSVQILNRNPQRRNVWSIYHFVWVFGFRASFRMSYLHWFEQYRVVWRVLICKKKYWISLTSIWLSGAVLCDFLLNSACGRSELKPPFANKSSNSSSSRLRFG